MVQALGTANLLQKNKCWENPPIPGLASEMHVCIDEECEDEEVPDDALASDVINLVLQEASSTHDTEDIASELSINGKDLMEHLISLHRLSFRRLPGTSMPLYNVDKTLTVTTNSPTSSIKQKHCLYNML